MRLDEIDKDNKVLRRRLDKGCGYIRPETAEERMARVIREQNEILKRMGMELIHVYVDEVSDDVKEL